jgi:hypothetical protein
MKMRWDTDRKWLYITVTDGPSEATVSLSAAEAEVLMSVAMQTPNFIALQAEAEQRALEMLNDRSASLQSIIEERGALGRQTARGAEAHADGAAGLSHLKLHVARQAARGSQVSGGCTTGEDIQGDQRDAPLSTRRRPSCR